MSRGRKFAKLNNPVKTSLGRNRFFLLKEGDGIVEENICQNRGRETAGKPAGGT